MQELLRKAISDGRWNRDGCICHEVNEIMTSNPVCIAEEKLAVEALKLLHEKNISSLIVLDSRGDYTGVVTIQMVINAL